MEDVKVKSLYKALKLLDCFTYEVPERGISELAELNGMLKSTVHNIVTTFEKCGFLEKNAENSKYRLGIKLLQLNNTLYMTNDLRKIARPYIEKISEYCNESVYFGIPSEHEVIYLDAVYPSGITAGRSIIGVKAPLYCTGIGKAILAYLPADEIEQVINSGLSPFTQNTIIQHDKLLYELDGIRKRGYSIDNMEHEYGIKCVAVPVRNIRDKVVAAISVSGPSLRFTDDKIVEFSNAIVNICKDLKNHIQR
jgi:DNA-binding IclR family transcriptional regulator